MTARRQCEVEGCDKPVTHPKSPYCEDHAHDWVGAAEIPLHVGRVASAVRQTSVMIQEETWVRVLEVMCGRCRLPYHRAVLMPCNPSDPVLRGGPAGRKRPAEEDEHVEVGRP